MLRPMVLHLCSCLQGKAWYHIIQPHACMPILLHLQVNMSHVQGIMASLKEDDEMVQEAALNELTELMSMSSEEALTVLPLEQLVPQLVCQPPC